MDTAQPVASLQASLADAGDGQIARVVAMVDAMRDRGPADALVAPLRGRLARMRPVRPTTVRRLLFTPADPLIVVPDRWQRGCPNVPRSALGQIAARLQAELPASLLSLDMPAAQVDPSRVAELWAAGGTILRHMAAPAGWAQATGLLTSDFDDIAASLSAALTSGQAISAAADGPADDAVLMPILRQAVATGRLGLAAVTAILLERLPSCVGAVVTAASRVAAASGLAVTDLASAHVLDQLEGRLAGSAVVDAATVAADAIRVATVLRGLDGSTNAESRGRADALRRQADMTCRQRFSEIVNQALRPTTAAAVMDDSEVDRIEDCARSLRLLEHAGQQLGSADHFAGLTRSATAMIQAQSQGALTIIDQARLVEILVGPDAAMQLIFTNSR